MTKEQLRQFLEFSLKADSEGGWGELALWGWSGTTGSLTLDQLWGAFSGAMEDLQAEVNYINETYKDEIELLWEEMANE